MCKKSERIIKDTKKFPEVYTSLSIRFLRFNELHYARSETYTGGRDIKNTRLVFSGTSLTSWGEGATLALVGHPSGDDVTIKCLMG